MKRYLEKIPTGIFRRLDHLGMAVPDLAAARIKWVETLGFTELEHELLPHQGVEIVILDGGNCRIELLAPVGDKSPIARSLSKRGPGVQHVAFEVDDMTEALASLAGNGIEPVAPPSQGAGGLLICFLHPRDTGGALLELVQYPRQQSQGDPL
jgi:methylmalonyl-CoA/ethylmalonyl-CoA epimerase